LVNVARTKQQRLSGYEPANEANYHIVRKPYLSASTLGSFLSCRVKPFIQRILEVFGIEITNAAMRRGAAAHAQVQGAFEALAAKSELTFKEALARKVFLLGTEVHLTDEDRKLHGFVDLMYAQEGKLTVLELKNTNAPMTVDPTWGVPVYPEHGMQVHLYGLAARAETGVTPRLFLSYLKGGSKERTLSELEGSRDPAKGVERLVTDSIAVPHGPEQRARVLREVHEFQKAEKGLEIPMPQHADPFLCGWCSVRAWCPRRLDQPGRFLALDPRKLPDGL
jgi:hypothetical protein